MQRINRPFVLRQKGRIIAHGKKDMYICRDKAGFCWIETCKNLKTTHQLLNITKNSFFVMMNVCIRKSEKQFSVEKKGKLAFTGREEDLFVSFPSGACYIFRGFSDYKNSITRIHSNGSLESDFIFCPS